jgi:hypothetical protein
MLDSFCLNARLMCAELLLEDFLMIPVALLMTGFANESQLLGSGHLASATEKAVSAIFRCQNLEGRA